MAEDLEIEDVLAGLNAVRRIHTGRKGKRVERDVCKEFNARFAPLLSGNTSWGVFSRSLGSGNRVHQVACLPKHASDTFTGDIVCPPTFVFTIESKGGYNDIDLAAVFGGGHREIDSFLSQASGDGDRSGRKPLVLWKKDRRPRLAMIRRSDCPPDFSPVYAMNYREWVVCSLRDLFSLPDSFFFIL